jgi:hypothetical protein
MSASGKGLGCRPARHHRKREGSLHLYRVSRHCATAVCRSSGGFRYGRTSELRPAAMRARLVLQFRLGLERWRLFHADTGTQIAIAHFLMGVPALYLAIDAAVRWTNLPVPLAVQALLAGALYIAICVGGRSVQAQSRAAPSPSRPACSRPHGSRLPRSTTRRGTGRVITCRPWWLSPRDGTRSSPHPTSCRRTCRRTGYGPSGRRSMR